MIFGPVLIKNLSKILIQAHDFWAGSDQKSIKIPNIPGHDFLGLFLSKFYQKSLSQVTIFWPVLMKNLSKILIPGHNFWAGFDQKSIKNPYLRS